MTSSCEIPRLARRVGRSGIVKGIGKILNWRLAQTGSGRSGDQVDGVDLEQIMANLNARGIQAESSERMVCDLALAHNLTPHQLYAIAVGETAAGRTGGGSGAGKHGQGGGKEHGSGQGIGRMTLKPYCEENGLDLNHAMTKLRQAGLEPSEEMTIRGIADAAGRHPSEIRGLLE